MRLTAIDIRDLRIISRAALEPAGVNLLTGPNAAGKTSVLEAIHLLGTARSFTQTRTEGLIRSGAGPLRVVGRVQAGSGAAVHRLGVERAVAGSWRMRMDGRNVERIATLAHALPVMAIHPGSHEILAGGPGERRRLLDWGLFHVEQGYLRQWQRYRRAIAQRNTLLRRKAPERELTAWEPEITTSATTVDELRRAYVTALGRYVEELAPRIMRDDPGVTLDYRPGWPNGETLAQALDKRRQRDQELGSTSVGPHRAELQVRVDGRDSRNRVSRGQQKLLVYLIRLAQARHLTAASGGGAVLLLDDLGAELDADHRERVIDCAIRTGSQLFVSALEAGAIPLPADQSFSLFHVEQGGIREVI